MMPVHRLRGLLLLSVLSLVLLCLSVSGVSAASYPLSVRGLGRRFDGIGGLSGGGATSRLLPDYKEPQRSDILDYLFTPGVGASLHILKVEIGGDAESTEGTEASHMHSADDENYHRGYEWWLMREAKRRNPDIKVYHTLHPAPPRQQRSRTLVCQSNTRVPVAHRWPPSPCAVCVPSSVCAAPLQLYGLAWGFPGWVAEGRSDPFTNSTARYITNWLEAARNIHQLHIDYGQLHHTGHTSHCYPVHSHRHAPLTSTPSPLRCVLTVGLWNERQTSRDYTLTLRRHLDAANISTRIVSADGGWGVCDDLVRDAEYAASIYALGAHYPNSATSANCAQLLAEQGKPLWASEDFSTLYTAGGCWARLLSHNYVLANLTSTISWNLGSFYYDELPWGKVGLMTGSQPWSGYWDVASVFWVTAHHTQFTRYGWRYLGHGNGVGHLEGGGTYLSLTDGAGNLTVVLEAVTANVSHCQYSAGPNDPITTQNVTLTLGAGFEHITSLNVFHSSLDTGSRTWFEHRRQLPVVNGAVTLTLNPNDLYTLSTLNGTKTPPAHPIPGPQPFPLPYTDSFDDRPEFTFPAYFDDQHGSFELVAATNTSRGRVVRQAAPTPPVAWCGGVAPLPFSVIGNHSWRAVTAEVDVLIEKNGTAFLGVGVASGGCLSERGADGIVLGLSVGGWVVSNTTGLRPVVAQGKVPVGVGEWVRLRLEVGEGGTSASVGGVEVAMLTGLSSRRYEGWVAIGSSYDMVQFDNLSISSNTSRTAPGQGERQEEGAEAVVEHVQAE